MRPPQLIAAATRAERSSTRNPSEHIILCIGGLISATESMAMDETSYKVKLQCYYLCRANSCLLVLLLHEKQASELASYTRKEACTYACND